jgi:hypothetical protein
MKMWLPVELHIFLHFYFIAAPYEAQGPAYHRAVRRFLAEGMIAPDERHPGGYEVTLRGEKFVEKLTKVQP